jgi:hypothetical protein
VALTGRGIAPVMSVSPTTLQFGGVQVGDSPITKQVSVLNTGDAPLVVSAAVIETGNDFSTANACEGVAVSPGGNCVVFVSYSPTTPGSKSSQLRIESNGASSAVIVTLTGREAALTLSSSSISFGDVSVGLLSSSSAITITNVSGAPVQLNSPTLTDSQNFSLTPMTTCPTSLASDATCSVFVRFNPVSSGSKSSTLSVTTNSAGLTLTANLTGQGVVLLGDSSTSPAISGEALRAARPGITSGFYWLDPDGAGGNAAFRTYVNYTLAGGDWVLVRKIGNTGGFGVFNDNLAGTQILSGYLADLAAGVSWAGKFDYFVDQNSEYLFSSGNEVSWCVLKKGSNNFDSVQDTSTRNSLVIASSGVVVAAGGLTNVLLRAGSGYPEDPFIGCEGTHTANATTPSSNGRMFYNEGELYFGFKNNNGGINIYVRKLKTASPTAMVIENPDRVAMGSGLTAVAPVIGSVSKGDPNPSKSVSFGGGTFGTASGTFEGAEKYRTRSSAVDASSSSSYRLSSDWRSGETTSIRWNIERLGYGGELFASDDLPSTTPVLWRRNREAVSIPTTGWVRKCADVVWVVQDGYSMIVSTRDASLVDDWASEISVGSPGEMVLVTRASCEGRGLHVQGYALRVDSVSPPLGLEAFLGRRFSLRIGPVQTGRPNLALAEGVISIEELCRAPEAELTGICDVLSSKALPKK